MRLPFRKSATSVKVPTDTVLPLNYIDGQRLARGIRLHVIFRFDDVLDAEKLRGAFARLLEMEGWRKLGARLRITVSRGYGANLSMHLTVRISPKESWSIISRQNSAKIVHHSYIVTSILDSRLPTIRSVLVSLAAANSR